MIYAGFLTMTEPSDDERWQSIVGYRRGYVGSYLVSDQGRVKSLDRKVVVRAGNYNFEGTLLTPYQAANGRLFVQLYCKNEKRTLSVDRLVAEAFLPKPPPKTKMKVVHINGDLHDNRAVNLEWQPRRKVAPVRTRQPHGLTSLTEEQVVAIRRRRAAGEPNKKLAVEYGVSRGTITDIVSRRTWSWVT